MLNKLDRALVRELQEGLPLVKRPFLAIARKLQITEEEVLAKIEEFLANGVIRRFGAAVRHQDLGFVANAMVVWRVPPERTREVGQIMASFPEVTHCYERACPPGWPYNLYTVLHGRTEEECRAVAARLSAASGITDYQVLMSTAELKKSSMKYFTEES
ncbi:MAG: Lrp/AsnC family transcriptional regulator [Desulfotomaculales bacterium]